MFNGIAAACSVDQQLTGIPVLKGIKDISVKLPGKIFYDYHFGGYARHTPELFSFMNEFYRKTGIPTDFVYTGKLAFALVDLCRKGIFPPGSRVLIIHSGGLQGNASLPKGTLIF
jgi:1-aminocyclopropane-1-carboxylate deaminase/D-cysteine desulfhydrase-like pyridoxal-dependent ACC family enzyme